MPCTSLSSIKQTNFKIKQSNNQTIKQSHRAFTIVEIMVVVAILGILLGIVSVAVTGTVKNSRKRRADAMCSMFEQAIATYYQQEGKWPSQIESQSGSMGNSTKYTFSPSETDAIMREIVEGSTGRNSKRYLIDASALFVADANRLKNSGNGCYDNHSDRSSSSFCGNMHCINGVDFTAVSNPSSKNHLDIGSMAFGYAGTKQGKFCRFWITYNSQTDSVTVSRKNPKVSYPDDWE